MILLTKEYQKIATGESKLFNSVTGYLELWAKYNSNDSNTNETNYSVQLRLIVSGGYIGNYQTTTCSLTATGITTSPINLGSDSYTSRVLRTITGTVKHNEDGKKNVDISGYVDFTAWGITLSVNSSAKLPDLHTPPSINLVNVTETNSILKNAGISDDIFVKWLSNKNFNFDVTTYDDAVINKYEVYNIGALISTSTELPVNIDFTKTNLYGNEQNKLVTFEYHAVDDKNGVGNLSQNYTFIPYFKPSFINTDTKAKRQGQTSGKAVLNASGTFYNSTIGNLKPSCQVYLKYWEKTSGEPTSYSEIPSENMTISENTFEIVDYLIGSAFDYKKSYYAKVYVQDGFYSSEPLILDIPVGEATWTEYKDRVDFKKATIQGKEVAIKEDIKQIYSTDEQVIGTWIDGKPIYRKVFDGELPTTQAWTTFATLENVDTLVKVGGYFAGNDGRKMTLPYCEGGYAISVTYHQNREIQIIQEHSSFCGRPCQIILEYTKTTD